MADELLCVEDAEELGGMVEKLNEMRDRCEAIQTKVGKELKDELGIHEVLGEAVCSIENASMAIDLILEGERIEVEGEEDGRVEEVRRPRP